MCDKEQSSENFGEQLHVILQQVRQANPHNEHILLSLVDDLLAAGHAGGSKAFRSPALVQHAPPDEGQSVHPNNVQCPWNTTQRLCWATESLARQ